MAFFPSPLVGEGKVESALLGSGESFAHRLVPQLAILSKTRFGYRHDR
jgi:hypothetical protein